MKKEESIKPLTNFSSFLLIGVTAVWGWTFVIVQDATRSDVYGVISFLTLRFIVASIALSVFAPKMTLRTFLIGVRLGVIVGLGYLLQTFGLRDTTPTNSGLITGLFVIFVPIADFVLYRVKLRPIFFLLLIVCIFGTFLLMGASLDQFQMYRYTFGGDLLTLGCAVAFGIDVSILSRHSKNHHSGALILAQMITSAILCGVAWIFFEPIKLPPNGSVWFAILLTGIVASALAFTVQAFVQKKISAIRVAIILTTEPLFAAIFGYFLAGDRLTTIQICGGLIIMIAIAISEIQPYFVKKFITNRDLK